MHGYFLLVGHPAKNFMPDVYFNLLPVAFTFYLRYKYYLIISKIITPLF
jgi:hypothetical protein